MSLGFLRIMHSAFSIAQSSKFLLLWFADRKTFAYVAACCARNGGQYICRSFKKSSNGRKSHISVFIMSHSLLWRHIVLLTVDVYSSNHAVLYNIGISMTRRFQKSVSPSVPLSVCNANKKAYSSFIIDSRIIIRISDKRAYHPLQENEAIF